MNPVFQQPIDRTPLRRHRCFKKNELQVLHVAFSRDPHPSSEVIQQLAEQLKAPVEKVRVSFIASRLKLIERCGSLFSNGSKTVDTAKSSGNERRTEQGNERRRWCSFSLIYYCSAPFVRLNKLFCFLHYRVRPLMTCSVAGTDGSNTA